MQQFHVRGMSCAACSARVEKAVSKVPGVTACSVSLLTNSMGVEGSAGADAIIQAVKDAGYGASAKTAEAKTPAATQNEDALAERCAEKPYTQGERMYQVLEQFSRGKMSFEEFNAKAAEIYR